MKNEWDEKLKFLLAIRTGWCNTDYLEFLIQKVWRVDRAVDVLDFGCGFGYVGLLLLPLLPEGSTYTGIDFSEVLLREAGKIFLDSPYKAKFFQYDLTEYVPEQNYDIATSQAVLRHIKNPKTILGKMVQSVRPGGWVICMETDRLLQDSGRYFSGMDYAELNQSELYKKLWKHELENGGRDYRTGMKIPQYMQELGLHDIQIRINDSVKFANPYSDDYEEVFNILAEANGWNKTDGEDEKQKIISALVNKGLDKDEANQYYENEALIRESVKAGFKKDYIMEMSCTPITFGRR